MNVWLSYWSSQNSNDRIGLYIGIYAMFGVVLSIFVILRSIVTFVVCGIKSNFFENTLLSFLLTNLMKIFLNRAAIQMHSGMLLNVLRAPMSFFDTTPFVPFFLLLCFGFL